ncbi:MAG: hypothetical protein GY862_14685, partial [Gammaproteobacteria bacterium]|nr:hypothetical protein [Gammaproteobacteria bacterium]
MARAAVETHAQAGAMEIRAAYFLRPLTVEDKECKEVHTRLSKQGDRFEFTISSRSGEGDRQEHAKGFIACIAAEPDKKHDIKAIGRECARQGIIIDPGFARKPPAELTGLEARLKQFGPRWHNLRRVKSGVRQGLAVLELPQGFAADLTGYQLHPALLDIAAGFLGMLEQYQGTLPFSYKRLTVRAPLPARFYSHVRDAGTQTAQPSGTRQFNVTLMDEQGVELVDIEEYTLLRAAGLPTEAPVKAPVGVCNPDRNVCGDSKRYGAGYKPAPAGEVPGDEVPVGVPPQAQGEKAAFPEPHQNVRLEIASPRLLDTL